MPRPIAFCTGATQGTCGVCMRVKPVRTSRSGLQRCFSYLHFSTTIVQMCPRVDVRRRRFESGTQSREHGQDHRKCKCRHHGGVLLAVSSTRGCVRQLRQACEPCAIFVGAAGSTSTMCLLYAGFVSCSPNPKTRGSGVVMMPIPVKGFLLLGFRWGEATLKKPPCLCRPPSRWTLRKVRG